MNHLDGNTSKFGRALPYRGRPSFRQTACPPGTIVELVKRDQPHHGEEGVMTSTGVAEGPSPIIARPVHGRTRVQHVLLTCGALSSLLYLATDILGGLRYEGYSFTSQAISELMAIGAPSESFVDPLFLIYGALALAFGVAVLREGVGRSRALRITGALLSTYAIVGFTGPTLFEMHARGAGSQTSDVPHIIITAVMVALLLSAMGVAAVALGKKFRLYTLASLAVVIAFGVAAASYGARLATGQPTPGFGTIERIQIYIFLLWIAVLSWRLVAGVRDRAPERPAPAPAR